MTKAIWLIVGVFAGAWLAYFAFVLWGLHQIVGPGL